MKYGWIAWDWIYFYLKGRERMDGWWDENESGNKKKKKESLKIEIVVYICIVLKINNNFNQQVVPNYLSPISGIIANFVGWTAKSRK